jgi:peptide/nickel transport system substrate-binding protein
MKRTLSLFLAAVSLLLAQALLPALSYVGTARASTRPRYGGTLRVELSARVASLDPAEIPEDWARRIAQRRLLNLVFDPLVRLDENGQPRPALALSWKSDAAFKRWEFRLRSGVKFHDGTLLAPSDVVSAIAKSQESWKVSASGDSIVISCNEPEPNLLFQLSLFFVARRSADGTIFGTGPFRLTTWQPGARAVFYANEDYWEGRPFVDSIEVQMGRPVREQQVDFELGKSDLVELAPDQIRALTQSGKRTWSSAPVVFYELWISSTGPSAALLRDSLSFAIDRAAIHNVLLQKQGEIAGGCLPQWLSGYSYLFSTERDLDNARKSRAKLPADLRQMNFAFDPLDPMARAIANRVALDAREIGVTLQVKTDSQMLQDSNADVELLRLNITLPHPGLAMDFVCPTLDKGFWAMQNGNLEQMYRLESDAREQMPFRIPLFYLPEIVGLSPRVKNWMPFRWGEWRLADVWLAADESAAPKLPEKP